MPVQSQMRVVAMYFRCASLTAWTRHGDGALFSFPKGTFFHAQQLTSRRDCTDDTPCTMDTIQDVVSLLEHARPTPEQFWDWWQESTRSPFETVKTVLFFYVLATQTLRVFRHLRARGLRRSVVDGYVWTSKVRLFIFSLVPWVQCILLQKALLLAMKLPQAQKKLQEELDKVKVDIEDKLVPKDGEVTRYLALPAQGKSAEWIIEEMARMDKELGAHTDWRDGKISGAVYRA